MKLVLRGFGFAALLVACTAFGFFYRDIRGGNAPSQKSLDGFFGVKVSRDGLSGEQVFRQNYQRILNNYVKPVKGTELKYAGISGMMASLGDPHTLFFPPRAAQSFSDETRGNFFGVGARLGSDPLGAKAGAVFEDGPAYRAGLRKGDIITAVNGVSVVGKDIEAIVDKVKGKEGTLVKLTIIPAGKTKPVVLSMKRARIVAPSVDSHMLPNEKIGYLAVTQFSEPTTSQFDREISKLEAAGMNGLIIDLRGNPGGLLETAVEMLSRFLEDKVVVTMKFRNGRDEVAKTSSGDRHNFNYPVVVLIDQDSASAAEIFSGCMHDYSKATLVGTRSYGKASVQNVFPLVDNSSAKVTIAKYYLPTSGFIGRKVDDDGVMISGGLEPDVKVELDTSKQVTFGEPDKDNQLARAVQVVKSKL